MIFPKTKSSIRFADYVLFRVVVIYLLLLPNLSDLKSQDYSEFLKKVTLYQDSVKLIQNNKKPPFDSVFICKSSFNIHTYLTLFDKLFIPKNYTIDYQYISDFAEGWPELYAKSINYNLDSIIQEKVKKEKFIDSVNNRPHEEFFQNNKAYEFARECNIKKDWFARDSVNEAWKYLIPQDNTEGYFQFLTFNLIGENFARYWHANYGYHFIICSQNQIKDLINLNDKEDFMVCFDKAKAKKLLKSNMTPILNLSKNQCTIIIYEFNTEGIYRNKYEITRKEPYSIKQLERELLLENSMRGLF